MPTTARAGTGDGSNTIHGVAFTNLTFPADSCGTTFLSPPTDGFALRDGEVRAGSPGEPTSYAVSLQTTISYGDLTGDGADEAVVMLDCTPGNRPVTFGWVYGFTDGRVTRLGGVQIDPSRIATGTSAPNLLSTAIADGAVVSTWGIYATGDPVCCPSTTAESRQRWTGSSLDW